MIEVSQLTEKIRGERVQRVLWGMAIAFYGVGDTITTIIGVRSTGVAEGGPLVLKVLETGGEPAFVLYKILLVGAFFGVWRAVSGPTRDSIPVVLTILGVIVTGWNTYVILS